MTDNTDAAQLRSLNVPTGAGPYKIVIVCEEAFMRGTDFRSPTVKMTLVVQRGFTSARHAQQALARVGRYNDDCYRIRCPGLASTLVDNKLQQAYLARLNAYLTAPVPQEIKTAFNAIKARQINQQTQLSFLNK